MTLCLFYIECIPVPLTRTCRLLFLETGFFPKRRRKEKVVCSLVVFDGCFGGDKGKGRKGKGREGREGKGRKGKERGVKEREGVVLYVYRGEGEIYRCDLIRCDSIRFGQLTVVFMLMLASISLPGLYVCMYACM